VKIIELPEMGQPESPLTPMMKQYLETKAQHTDALLFFRLGDFYELFFDDAVKAAGLLGITLTSRPKGGERIPMCGVPHHAAKRYIGRLVEAGHRVAICEQTSPVGKGIVSREVVRVISPGMVLDDDVLDAKRSNFLAAVLPSVEGGWGAALIEASTGEFLAVEAGTADEVLELLARESPKEILVAASWVNCVDTGRFLSAPIVSVVPDEHFSVKRGRLGLQKHFAVQSLDGFGLKGNDLSVAAAAAALTYLKETQKTAAAHIDRIALWARSSSLGLDESTRANLELLRTLQDQSRAGSLFSAIDRTSTSVGARRLARWLSAPLRDVARMAQRHDAVGELLLKPTHRRQLKDNLKAMVDLERLAAKVTLRSGTPREVFSLGQSLVALPSLVIACAELQAPLLKETCEALRNPALQLLGTRIIAALVDDAPATQVDGGYIRVGFHSDLDKLIALSTTGKDSLLLIEQREREHTKINSLKVKFNNIFGYYLEVTKANLHLVPKDWIRKQTTVNGERFVTEELKNWEEKVLSAEEQRGILESKIFESLRIAIEEHVAFLRAAADSIATLDVLVAFATVAEENNYVRPEVDESTGLALLGLRHPVVETLLPPGNFVSNDLCIDRETSQMLIITGPNMAGKSTLMRQTALAVVMAQAGSFVAASSAHIGVCDRVFTRVGASDNLARGQSTFMIEMSETANILHHATRRSLVVLDEIGRGTSTFDGLSIAWAVAEHLHDRIGARTLFATHYHELTDLSREKPRVKNVSLAVREDGQRVVFLRKLVDGAANRSYGIEVAKLAGLPAEVLARARELLKNLEAGEFDERGRPRLAKRATMTLEPVHELAEGQLALFKETEMPPVPVDPILMALLRLDINRATPLSALNLMAEWQQALKARGEK
jgi:DNA mismatch repair protein MutS